MKPKKKTVSITQSVYIHISVVGQGRDIVVTTCDSTCDKPIYKCDTTCDSGDTTTNNTNNGGREGRREGRKEGRREGGNSQYEGRREGGNSLKDSQCHLRHTTILRSCVDGLAETQVS